MSYGTIYGPEKFFWSKHRSLKFCFVTASFDPIESVSPGHDSIRPYIINM